MRNLFFVAVLGCLLSSQFFLVSCERLGDKTDVGRGRLCVSFASSGQTQMKSLHDLPDTSDFILTIRKSDGTVLYDGLLGDCPEALEVDAGAYIVSALSGTFVRPAFDSPLFGDEQCVVVPSGGRVEVRLVCTQMNAGVSLEISPDFLTTCSDGILFLKSAAGKLMYSYSEKRSAYFPPGMISLILDTQGKEEVLMTRQVNASEMLSVKVSVASSKESAGAYISMAIDTSRIWINDSCTIGKNEEVQGSGAMTVAQARNAVGKEEVWVSGYIVGGDLTASAARFEHPFKTRSNLLVGPRSSTNDRAVCLSVQLPEGDVREALNLVDHPENLKRRVCVKGDVVEAYFGIPGLKNTIAFDFL